MLKRICDRCGKEIEVGKSLYEVHAYERSHRPDGTLDFQASKLDDGVELCENCYGEIENFIKGKSEQTYKF